ncbi:L,D-transpeptidase [Anabaena sp. FACHB-1237]|uniref:L,D-transpeptidase n=1 Tax=Anabaena sp. FACHB-1237 TaxID=2692769 RepID=UPI0016810243|nr:L,D-transpeptidase [Anabaena sp. FACHB-1237]MBD2138214.1 L,D-transpeptidase [Anabaena sp. FACHB-1237]
MMNQMYYQNACKFCLTTSVIFLLLPLSANAQTKLKEAEINNYMINQPNSNLLQIDDSVKKPISQNYLERIKMLIMRNQIEYPQPILNNYKQKSEQNIYLLIILKNRKVYVYKDNILQATYPVAIGKQGWETPTGKFTVINMVENPDWENPFNSSKEIIPPGLQNPLGERWIGFWTDGKDEIGFHGTYKRDSVGKAISHGCIRMYNEDVRKLYEIVKIGTPVIVIP